MTNQPIHLYHITGQLAIGDPEYGAITLARCDLDVDARSAAEAAAVAKDALVSGLPARLHELAGDIYWADDGPVVALVEADTLERLAARLGLVRASQLSINNE